jgi:hypothetical protein
LLDPNDLLGYSERYEVIERDSFLAGYLLGSVTDRLGKAQKELRLAARFIPVHSPLEYRERGALIGPASP